MAAVPFHRRPRRNVDLQARLHRVRKESVRRARVAKLTPEKLAELHSLGAFGAYMRWSGDLFSGDCDIDDLIVQQRQYLAQQAAHEAQQRAAVEALSIKPQRSPSWRRFFTR